MYLWLKITSNHDKKPAMTFKRFPPVSPKAADQFLGQVLKFLLISSAKIQCIPSAFAFPTEKGVHFNTL